jgi:hypothetical protein
MKKFDVNTSGRNGSEFLAKNGTSELWERSPLGRTSSPSSSGMTHGPSVSLLVRDRADKRISLASLLHSGQIPPPHNGQRRASLPVGRLLPVPGMRGPSRSGSVFQISAPASPVPSKEGGELQAGEEDGADDLQDLNTTVQSLLQEVQAVITHAFFSHKHASACKDYTTHDARRVWSILISTINKHV